MPVRPNSLNVDDEDAVEDTEDTVLSCGVM